MDDVRKNTVPAENQTVRCVICDEHITGNIRLLFLGNSMTYHGRKDDLGWYNSCGMAASCTENDYVHRLVGMLGEKGFPVDKCIVNVADWERDYKNGDRVLSRGIYRSAADFDADIIILRFLENCPPDNWNKPLFKKHLLELMDYFNPSGKAQIILTTSFWRHIGSESMEEIARENKLPCVGMTDLGDKDSMKAIGKFENEAVAMHPGDLGMESMAKRLLPAVINEINKIRS